MSFPILRRTTAAEILAQFDEVQLWSDLLTDGDSRIKLDALKYLTDRRDGKALQAVADVTDQPAIRVILEQIGRTANGNGHLPDQVPN